MDPAQVQCDATSPRPAVHPPPQPPAALTLSLPGVAMTAWGRRASCLACSCMSTPPMTTSSCSSQQPATATGMMGREHQRCRCSQNSRKAAGGVEGHGCEHRGPAGAPVCAVHRPGELADAWWGHVIHTSGHNKILMRVLVTGLRTQAPERAAPAHLEAHASAQRPELLRYLYRQLPAGTASSRANSQQPDLVRGNAVVGDMLDKPRAR